LVSINQGTDPAKAYLRAGNDRRDYCWAVDIEGNSYILHVFNGNEWEVAPAGLFNSDKITTIEIDLDNNIWIGTRSNGVFILKQ
jgi:hypothetical protein